MNKSPAHLPSHDAIAARARLLWTAAGSPLDDDLNYWLRAEQELSQEAATSDEPEVIDLDADTAFGEIDSVPHLSGSLSRATTGGSSQSRKGTSL
jgi:hypothetical protein